MIMHKGHFTDIFLGTQADASLVARMGQWLCPSDHWTVDGSSRSRKHRRLYMSFQCFHFQSHRGPGRHLLREGRHKIKVDQIHKPLIERELRRKTIWPSVKLLQEMNRCLWDSGGNNQTWHHGLTRTMMAFTLATCICLVYYSETKQIITYLKNIRLEFLTCLVANKQPPVEQPTPTMSTWCPLRTRTLGPTVKETLPWHAWLLLRWELGPLQVKGCFLIHRAATLAQLS